MLAAVAMILSVVLLNSFLCKDVLVFKDLYLSVLHESQYVVQPKKPRVWENKLLGNTCFKKMVASGKTGTIQRLINSYILYFCVAN